MGGELRGADGGDSYGGRHDGSCGGGGGQVGRMVMVESEVWRKGLV